MEWRKWEDMLTSSVKSAFDWAFEDRLSPKKFITVIKEKTKPVLEEAHRQAMIMLMLLWMQEDWVRDVWKWFDDEEDKRRMLLDEKARKSGRRHADRLAVQLVRSTKRMRKRRPDETTEEDWDEQLFSRDRAYRVGVTEVTRAVSLGEDIAAQQANKERWTLQSIWMTEEDDRVCPVCGPLHGKSFKTWSLVFPDGPPAHVFCRCRREWKILQDSTP